MAKSIADKADVGAIMSEVMKEDLAVLDKVIKARGCRPPTMVTDLYKVRRSMHKGARIWSYVDLGTARVVDLFVTDKFYNPIELNVVRALFSEPSFPLLEDEELDEETGEITTTTQVVNDTQKGRFAGLL